MPNMKFTSKSLLFRGENNYNVIFKPIKPLNLKKKKREKSSQNADTKKTLYFAYSTSY